MTVRRPSIAIVVLLIAGLGGRADAQTIQQIDDAKLPRFDVASVKPNTSDAFPSSRFPLGPGDAYVAGNVFAATNVPLATYIRFAFGRSQGESLSLPSWANDERFDIQGRTTGAPTKDEMRLMMRALLTDRFKLAWHVERREEAVFELNLAASGKVGPQLTPHHEGRPCGPGAALGSDPAFDAIACGSAGLVFASSAGKARISGRDEPLAALAAMLSNNAFAGVDRALLDHTGLTGKFDFTAEWAIPLPPTESATRLLTDESRPSFGTAFREQLGLTLRATRALLDVPVIDHIERPEPD